MGNKLFPLLIGLLLAFYPLAGEKVQALENPQKIRLRPDHIFIGLFFGGRSVHLESEIPVGHDVVIRVTGPGEPLEFKKKGKKFGLIWMSEGEVHYEDVPSLYIIRSSQRLSQLASGQTLNQLKIGYEAVQAEVTNDSDTDAQALFGDLVKLKERDGLFSVKEGSVEVQPLGEGEQKVSCDFLLPAKTPVGECRVDVFAFEKGRGLLSATGRVRIERSSVISFIISMVTKHGLLYGCLAVGIAIIAGLGTGLVFGTGKGGAH